MGGQRIVRLAVFQPHGPGLPPANSVHFRMPASHLLAPPGWYMLFALTNEGVPANAYWINLR